MAPAGVLRDPGAGTRQVRIYVLDVELIERAVACLAAALQSYPGRRDVEFNP